MRYFGTESLSRVRVSLLAVDCGYARRFVDPYKGFDFRWIKHITLGPEKSWAAIAKCEAFRIGGLSGRSVHAGLVRYMSSEAFSISWEVQGALMTWYQRRNA